MHHNSLYAFLKEDKNMGSQCFLLIPITDYNVTKNFEFLDVRGGMNERFS